MEQHDDPCPGCGRPRADRERSWAFDLAAIFAVFGVASMVYALGFHETIVVTEERVKFWFGFQLLTLAVACGAVGWWHRARGSIGRAG